MLANRWIICSFLFYSQVGSGFINASGWQPAYVVINWSEALHCLQRRLMGSRGHCVCSQHCVLSTLCALNIVCSQHCVLWTFCALNIVCSERVINLQGVFLVDPQSTHLVSPVNPVHVPLARTTFVWIYGAV